MAPSRVVTVDLHCGQIQGFFHQTPVDNLFAENEMLHYLKTKNFPKDKLVIVRLFFFLFFSFLFFSFLFFLFFLFFLL